jgi:hypothetical protein
MTTNRLPDYLVHMRQAIADAQFEIGSKRRKTDD